MGEERNSMQTFFTNKTPEGEILPGFFFYATKMQPADPAGPCQLDSLGVRIPCPPRKREASCLSRFPFFLLFMGFFGCQCENANVKE